MKKTRVLKLVGLSLILSSGAFAQQITGSSIFSPAGGGARILATQGDTPSNPAIGFQSSVSTTTTAQNDGGGGNGIYRPTANTMAFATASVERMRITAGGAIGIGTMSPVTNFDLNAAGGYFRVNAGDGGLEIGSANDGLSFIDFKGSTNLASDWRGRIIHDDAKGFSFYTNVWSNPMRLTNDGKVLIGALSPSGIHANALLGVDGKILAKSIYVNTTTWADYVFDENYVLPSLSDVEKYYKENKHLPEIPSEKEVLQDGINVAEMNKLLLKKIEEMTLYMVELKKEIEVLKQNKK